MADSKLNQFVARGTSSERDSFVPSPPTPASGPDPLHIWFETDTEDTYAWDGTHWVQVNSAAGDVATDTIWDAAGDLAVGTGSNTAARLAIGANGTVLTSNGTTASWAAAAAGSFDERDAWLLG